VRNGRPAWPTSFVFGLPVLIQSRSSGSGSGTSSLWLELLLLKVLLLS